MVRYICFAVVIAVSLIAAWWLDRILERSEKKPHISGKLVIDKTGEADRWTFVLDDDLSDVEKMNQVILRIEKIE